MADPLEEWRKKFPVKYALPPDSESSKSVLGAKMLTRPDESYLRQQYPMISGALKGFMGSAPDEIGGSVFDPKTAQEREGAKAGFIGGTLFQMAPLVGPALRTMRGVAGAALSGPAAGTRAAQRGVIKAPGGEGNWLSGSVEHALKPIKSGNNPILSGEIINEAAGRDLFSEYRKVYDRDPTVGLHDWMRANHPDIYAQIQNPEDRAMNRWIDNKLTKYIKTDMATERDPVRALAERGVLHVDPRELNFRLDMHGVHLRPGQTAVGVSPAAKSWEGASDLAVGSDQAGNLLKEGWRHPTGTGPEASINAKTRGSQRCHRKPRSIPRKAKLSKTSASATSSTNSATPWTRPAACRAICSFSPKISTRSPCRKPWSVSRRSTSGGQRRRLKPTWLGPTTQPL